MMVESSRHITLRKYDDDVLIHSLLLPLKLLISLLSSK